MGTVTLRGVPEVVKAFADRGIDLQAALKAGLRAGAELVAADAASRAPRRVGKLAESLVIQETADQQELQVFVGPSADAFYAKFVEFGTAPHAVGKGSDLTRASGRPGKQTGGLHPGARAKPFLFPALEAQHDAVIEQVTGSVQSAIEGGGA